MLVLRPAEEIRTNETGGSSNIESKADAKKKAKEEKKKAELEASSGKTDDEDQSVVMVH